MLKALDEAVRVLKPSGLFVATLIFTKAWKYGLGQQVEHNTFIQPEELEVGVAHHYADERDALDLMTDFAIQSLDQNESSTIDDRVDHHWEIVAMRR
jgi:hypothetical protein